MPATQGTVLICTLGDAPGAVTSSLDVLVDHRRRRLGEEGFGVNRVVVLMTPQADPLPQRERESHTHQCAQTPEKLSGGKRRTSFSDVQPEILGNYYPEKYGFRVDECRAQVLNVKYDDLYCDEEAVDFLRLCLREIVSHREEGWSVHLAITGGRKTMSALALSAAIMAGEGANCFQAALPAGLEKTHAAVYEAHQAGWQGQVLHPPEAWYVPAAVGVTSQPLAPSSPSWVQDVLDLGPGICSLLQHRGEDYVAGRGRRP